MKFKELSSSIFKLALPVIITQMGQMLMGLVDIYMVGKLGPESIGGVAVGNAIYFSVSVFGIGLLLGLDFLVSHAYGKKELNSCHYWLIQGVYFAFMVTPLLALLIYGASFVLMDFGIAPEIAGQAAPFMRILCLSLLPFLLFMAFRQYLQAMNSVRAVTAITLLANVANVFFNWLFIYGNWGMPALGTAGSGIATTLTRTLLAMALIAFVYSRDHSLKLGLIQMSWRLEWKGIRHLVSLGLPAGFQVFFEVAVFSLATALAGRLGAIPLAAHSVVLSIASFTFMVPLGISAAASVRVGQSLGEKDPMKARMSGWICLLMGVGFMTFSAVVLALSGKQIIAMFTPDISVIELGAKIILLAAFFQIADGIQTVGTGALRGLNDTQSPMFANLIGHWLIGLPIGYYLCFHTPWQILGLWAGLTSGLIVVAVIVLGFWIWRTQKMAKTFILHHQKL